RDGLERFGFEFVDATLRYRAHRHESRGSQDLEVLGHLRLPDAERVDDVADRQRSAPQQLDDAQPARLTDGRENDRFHDPDATTHSYSCQGIRCEGFAPTL